MMHNHSSAASDEIGLQPVTADNWRAVAAVRVRDEQSEFVATPTYYLALCHYGKLWHPMAICCGKQVVGFLMWAIDPDDGSCWLGGFQIDRDYQGRGIGSKAVRLAIKKLGAETGATDFALSYDPANAVGRHLYVSVGFVETGETEGDEIVARLTSL
jgi:diamine N-acetyltransferase